MRKEGYPFFHEDGENGGHESDQGMDYWDFTKSCEPSGYDGIRVADFDNSVSKIDIKNYVTGVGRKAFYGCDRLEEVRLGKENYFIESKAFASCINLKKLFIPSTTTIIEEKAFENCPSLTIYTVKDSYAAKYAEAHHIPVSYSDKNIKNEKIKLRALKVENENEYELMYGIRLKWNPTESADGYQIQKKADGEKYSTCFDIKDRDTCSKTIYPDIETSYYGKDMSFRIRAYSVGSDGKKHYTAYSSVKVSFWPEQPKITSLTRKSGNKLTVRWKKTKYTDGYEVWRSANGKPFVCVKKINSKNAHSFTDIGLKKGVRYTYSIKSYRVNYQNRKVYGDILMQTKRDKIKY